MKPTGEHRLFKVHLFTNPLTAKTFHAVGCGWSPQPSKVQPLSAEDWLAEVNKYDFCKNCWSKFSLPSSWAVVKSTPPESKEGAESDSSSSDGASKDSESEAEGHAL